MRTGHLLFSAVQFLFVVGVLCLGVLLIALSGSMTLRSIVVDFFMKGEGMLAFMGISVLVVGLLLLMGFYSMHRGTYLQMEMRDGKTQVEVGVIRQYAELYWKQALPGHQVRTEVWIYPNQRIEMAVEIPHLSSEELQEVLERVEKELSALLQEKIGYSREFVFNVVV
jgi:hypothetical protein